MRHITGGEAGRAVLNMLPLRRGTDVPWVCGLRKVLYSSETDALSTRIRFNFGSWARAGIYLRMPPERWKSKDLLNASDALIVLLNYVKDKMPLLI